MSLKKPNILNLKFILSETQPLDCSLTKQNNNSEFNENYIASQILQLLKSIKKEQRQVQMTKINKNNCLRKQNQQFDQNNVKKILIHENILLKIQSILKFTLSYYQKQTKAEQYFNDILEKKQKQLKNAKQLLKQYQENLKEKISKLEKNKSNQTKIQKKYKYELNRIKKNKILIEISKTYRNNLGKSLTNLLEINTSNQQKFMTETQQKCGVKSTMKLYNQQVIKESISKNQIQKRNKTAQINKQLKELEGRKDKLEKEYAKNNLLYQMMIADIKEKIFKVKR